jgi:hypothetical protein
MIRRHPSVLSLDLRVPFTAFYDKKKTFKIPKSFRTVMPDLIRHPELFEITGFRPSPE